jgi:hypothetical protein
MMPGHILDLGRRFCGLEPGDRRLVVEAIVLVGLAYAGVRTVPFIRLRRLFDAAKKLRSRSRHPASRITWALDAAAQVMPRRNCLNDALAADVMLCRRGHNSMLRLGVRKGPQRGAPLEAHAWVESGGAIVAGGLDMLDDYKLLPNINAS